jgi:hypothetical protein
MPRGKRLPPKREVAHALLTQGAAFVHLDPRAVDVVVPDWLKRQPQLVLQIGLSMPVPIRDLRVDDAGVFGTLSFNRAPFTCLVPWHAVFALVGDDGRGMVWPDSMPPEIAQEIEREAERASRSAALESGKAQPNEPAASKRPRKPRPLRTVEPAPDVEREDIDAIAQTDSRDFKPGLRLIPGQASEAAPSALSSARRARRAPHLRLVKP